MTELNSSDSRGVRLDFFLKQEEVLTTEASYLGPSESEEAAGGAGRGAISSVANLKAALMSKNSLLSMRADMMGDDNPLLYEYLPKGGHSLSCKSLFTNTVLTHSLSQTHMLLSLPTNCFLSTQVFLTTCLYAYLEKFGCYVKQFVLELLKRVSAGILGSPGRYLNGGW